MDCKPALQAIEGAWRRGRIETGRGGERGAMLEEICRLRAALGRVVFLWVPSHVGISPNSMADAVAKTYLTQTPDAAGVARIAVAVRTRPCLYAARQGDGDAPARCATGKIVYAEVYARSKAWACEQLRKGTTRPGAGHGSGEEDVDGPSEAGAWVSGWDWRQMGRIGPNGAG